MAYKDKDKQREANRKAQAKFKAKGITEGITEMGIIGRVLPVRRGKDIKCFEDLPPDVQRSIKSEKPEERARRTAAAIKYQHIFPDRHYPNSDLRFTTMMAGYVPPGRER